MAELIYVSGPTAVYANNVLLGWTDNDSLATITYTDHQHEVKTVQFGEVPAEVVVTGLSAVLTVTLVKWDQAHLDTILIRTRGTAALPYTAKVGTTLVNDFTAGVTALYPVKLLPTTSNKTFYQLNSCYLKGESSDGGFGNVERRMTLTFMGISTSATTAVVTTGTTA